MKSLLAGRHLERPELLFVAAGRAVVGGVRAVGREVTEEGLLVLTAAVDPVERGAEEHVGAVAARSDGSRAAGHLLQQSLLGE